MSKNKEKENDDVKVEVEVPSEESAESATETIEEVVVDELSEEEKLKNRIVELEDKIARKSAEFENYKKRTARQYDDMIKFANEKTISDILDVVSDFDRALSHEDSNVTLESFTEGIKMIHNKLHAIIDKYDVKPIEAIGKQFDPNLHEALMHVESNEFDEGIVAFEMNKGYTMGGKVIRHSRVGVAKPKEQNAEENNEDNNENNDEDNNE